MAFLGWMSGIVIFLGFVIIMTAAIAHQYKKSPIYKANASVYVRVKDLPSEIKIDAGKFKKIIIALTGKINLRTTRLTTDAVSFSIPKYEDGLPVPGYRASYLVPQESPGLTFGRLAYLQLYGEGGMSKDTDNPRGAFHLNFAQNVDNTLSSMRQALYKTNNGARVHKQISAGNSHKLFENALRNDLDLKEKTRPNHLPGVLLIIALVSLIASVILRNPVFAFVPAILVSIVLVGHADRKSEIWSWMFQTRKKYVGGKITAQSLLPVLSYRNYLEGLHKQTEGKPAYTEPDSGEAWATLVWTSAFQVEDSWFRNFSTI